MTFETQRLKEVMYKEYNDLIYAIWLKIDLSCFIFIIPIDSMIRFLWWQFFIVIFIVDFYGGQRFNILILDLTNHFFHLFSWRNVIIC